MCLVVASELGLGSTFGWDYHLVHAIGAAYKYLVSICCCVKLTCYFRYLNAMIPNVKSVTDSVLKQVEVWAEGTTYIIIMCNNPVVSFIFKQLPT